MKDRGGVDKRRRLLCENKQEFMFVERSCPTIKIGRGSGYKFRSCAQHVKLTVKNEFTEEINGEENLQSWEIGVLVAWARQNFN